MIKPHLKNIHCPCRDNSIPQLVPLFTNCASKLKLPHVQMIPLLEQFKTVPLPSTISNHLKKSIWIQMLKPSQYLEDLNQVSPQESCLKSSEPKSPRSSTSPHNLSRPSTILVALLCTFSNYILPAVRSPYLHAGGIAQSWATWSEIASARKGTVICRGHRVTDMVTLVMRNTSVLLVYNYNANPNRRRGPGSRSLLWFASHDESTRGPSCKDLLLPPSSSTIDMTQSWTRCDRTTGFSVSNLTTGLLQLCADSFTGVNVGTAPESPQRRCSVGSWFGTTWSCDTGHVLTSLVTNCRENQVHTLPLGTPHSQWSCTIVSSRVDYSQHPRTRLSPLSWKARSGCSAFETGFIRAGVFSHCTKSVEQPARWH